MSRFIPYSRQWIDDEDIEAVASVLGSDFLPSPNTPVHDMPWLFPPAPLHCTQPILQRA
jgi:hypothetical protein